MDSDFLIGTGVALVTPFRDGSVDFPSLEAIVNRCLEHQIDYLVPLGTTGEASTLTTNEKQKVFNFVADLCLGKIPVVFGAFGGNNTADILRWFDTFDLSRASAILSATPSYSKPSQKGLIEHYQVLANRSPVPVIVYNVPGRTCVDMDIDTIVHLSTECEQIVAIKEANPNLGKAAKLVKRCPPEFKLLSGDDPTAFHFVALGGHGVISVIGNAMPGEFSTMIRHTLNGNLIAARNIHTRLIDLHDHLYIEGNPVGIKALLSHQGFCENEVRLPLAPLSSENFDRLIAEYKQCLHLLSKKHQD